MNNIGVFICNYNGKEWVRRCIESLYRQTKKCFDIFVVDNASTDGSVESIKESYGEKVGILKNSENIGGAGGFERGIQYGMRKGYNYIALLDNDIELDSFFFENALNYMESHNKVGLVGSKVMIMDEPEFIQDFGCKLDYEKYKEIQLFPLLKDDENIPKIQECDYVPTCAVMIRTRVLEKSGTMPEDNFIYYDDIELSQKIIRAGFQVVALGSAKVWHKGGFRKGAISTFPKYYFLRNRLHFFSKFIKEEDIDRFVDVMLGEVFAQLFGYFIKNSVELFDTVNYAFYDYLNGIRGKAADNRIRKIVRHETPFENCVKEKENICIEMIDNYDREQKMDIFYVILFLMEFIQTSSPKRKIVFSLEHCSYSKQGFSDYLEQAIYLCKPKYLFPKYSIVDFADDSYDLVIRLCSHVRNVSEYNENRVYVDRYANCLSSMTDYNTFANYEFSEKLFKAEYRKLMHDRIKQIRSLNN